MLSQAFDYSTKQFLQITIMCLLTDNILPRSYFIGEKLAQLMIHIEVGEEDKLLSKRCQLSIQTRLF